MSFIQNFFTSRDNNANAASYVGQEGRLWWDPVTNKIYYSDGSTPGGIPVTSGGGGGAANIEVSNQSLQITNSVSSFNFIGSGVTANAVGNAVTVDIPGAGYINFDGGSPSNFYGGGPAFDCGGVY